MCQYTNLNWILQVHAYLLQLIAGILGLHIYCYLEPATTRSNHSNNSKIVYMIECHSHKVFSTSDLIKELYLCCIFISA